MNKKHNKNHLFLLKTNISENNLTKNKDPKHKFNFSTDQNYHPNIDKNFTLPEQTNTLPCSPDKQSLLRTAKNTTFLPKLDSITMPKKLTDTERKHIIREWVSTTKKNINKTGAEKHSNSNVFGSYTERNNDEDSREIYKLRTKSYDIPNFNEVNDYIIKNNKFGKLKKGKLRTNLEIFRNLSRSYIECESMIKKVSQNIRLFQKREFYSNTNEEQQIDHKNLYGDDQYNIKLMQEKFLEKYKHIPDHMINLLKHVKKPDIEYDSENQGLMPELFKEIDKKYDKESKSNHVQKMLNDENPVQDVNKFYLEFYKDILHDQNLEKDSEKIEDSGSKKSILKINKGVLSEMENYKILNKKKENELESYKTELDQLVYIKSLEKKIRDKGDSTSRIDKELYKIIDKNDTHDRNIISLQKCQAKQESFGNIVEELIKNRGEILLTKKNFKDLGGFLDGTIQTSMLQNEVGYDTMQNEAEYNFQNETEMQSPVLLDNQSRNSHVDQSINSPIRVKSVKRIEEQCRSIRFESKHEIEEESENFDGKDFENKILKANHQDDLESVLNVKEIDEDLILNEAGNRNTERLRTEDNFENLTRKSYNHSENQMSKTKKTELSILSGHGSGNHAIKNLNQLSVPQISGGIVCSFKDPTKDPNYIKDRTLKQKHQILLNNIKNEFREKQKKLKFLLDTHGFHIESAGQDNMPEMKKNFKGLTGNFASKFFKEGGYKKYEINCQNNKNNAQKDLLDNLNLDSKILEIEKSQRTIIQQSTRSNVIQQSTRSNMIEKSQRSNVSVNTLRPPSSKMTGVGIYSERNMQTLENLNAEPDYESSQVKNTTENDDSDISFLENQENYDLDNSNIMEEYDIFKKNKRNKKLTKKQEEKLEKLLEIEKQKYDELNYKIQNLDHEKSIDQEEDFDIKKEMKEFQSDQAKFCMLKENTGNLGIRTFNNRTSIITNENNVTQLESFLENLNNPNHLNAKKQSTFSQYKSTENAFTLGNVFNKKNKGIISMMSEDRISSIKKQQTSRFHNQSKFSMFSNIDSSQIDYSIHNKKHSMVQLKNRKHSLNNSKYQKLQLLSPRSNNKNTSENCTTNPKLEFVNTTVNNLNKLIDNAKESNTNHIKDMKFHHTAVNYFNEKFDQIIDKADTSNYKKASKSSLALEDSNSKSRMTDAKFKLAIMKNESKMRSFQKSGVNDYIILPLGLKPSKRIHM